MPDGEERIHGAGPVFCQGQHPLPVCQVGQFRVLQGDGRAPPGKINRVQTCGAMGMPDCDKVPKPSGFLKAEKNKVEPPKGKKVEAVDSGHPLFR